MEVTEKQTGVIENFNITYENEADGSFRILVTTANKELVAHSRFTKTHNSGEIPDDLKKILNSQNCHVFLSNIGVNEKFRGKGIGKSLYLISIKKLIEQEDGGVMELVQDQSKRKSGDTQWEETKRQEFDELLSTDHIQTSILWKGLIDNDPSKLIIYNKSN